MNPKCITIIDTDPGFDDLLAILCGEHSAAAKDRVIHPEFHR
ncbi:MAG: hypothetical protein PVJ21_05255 [Anaerolineales bacterium]|jgi:hypothetical protein